MDFSSRSSIPSNMVDSIGDDDEVQVLKTKGNKRVNAMEKLTKKEEDEENDKSLWTKAVLSKFLDAMVEEVHKGNRTTTTFSRVGWNMIIGALRDYNITKNQCTNKFNKLRSEYTCFKNLCKETGIVVNPETGMIYAEDNVWDKLKKVIKGCNQFRKNGCPHFPKLQIIFGDTTATGENAHPSTKMPSDSENDDDNEDVQILEKGEKDDYVEVKREKRVKITKDKRRYSFASTMGLFMQQMAENSKKRNEILEKQIGQVAQSSETIVDSGVETVNKSIEDLTQFSECVAALNELQDIDGSCLVKAMKLLREDPYMRVGFLKFSEDKRKDFVLNLMDAFHKVLKIIDDMEEAEEEDVMNHLLALGMAEYYQLYLDKKPCRTSKLKGHDYLLEVLNGNETRCYESFRMEPSVFIAFCEELKTKCGLEHSRYVTAQEQVAMFLLVLSHNERNRLVAERFQHSGQTVSKYFNHVLKLVCKLGVSIITPPDQNVVAPEIRHDRRYYPFFQDCVGAIDGTHISASVPITDQIPYRGKKIEPTQNIICVCSFDMCFTFVISGWEGTANDSRIIIDTAARAELGFPMPIPGKYYVVDAGFTNMPGFLSPYRGERYHLNDYRGRQPMGLEELFNYRHSSLRNVIERCFGVLKARFPILKQMPPFPVRTQRYIPIACCTIHNFIRRLTKETTDRLFDAYGDNDTVAGSSQNPIELDISQRQIREMSNVRDEIAKKLWDSFRG